MIAAALRRDFGDQYSSIKQIARHTQASLSTIKKWYEGRNPPNCCNLIELARFSPSVFQVLMELIGRNDLWRRYQSELAATELYDGQTANSSSPVIYPEESFGITVNIDFAIGNKLNARQLWFLGLLQKGHRIRAEHIAVAWRVTTRSGESDISGLKKMGLVRYVGAKRNGGYEIV